SAASLSAHVAEVCAEVLSNSGVTSAWRAPEGAEVASIPNSGTSAFTLAPGDRGGAEVSDAVGATQRGWRRGSAEADTEPESRQVTVRPAASWLMSGSRMTAPVVARCDKYRDTVLRVGADSPSAALTCLVVSGSPAAPSTSIQR